jgi:uncharacterized protein (TIGR02145 family)
VTPAANGCQGIDNSVIVTINPAPMVTFSVCNDIATTTESQPYNLKGGIPLGGIYSGRGVNNGVFHPSVAGIGPDTISYTYSNAFSCSDTGFIVINVISSMPFNCGDILTDIRDNKTYPTVQIGTQCWMASNLNYGNIIPGSYHQRDNCFPEKYCFNDIPGNCDLGASLYQWDELMRFDNTISDQGLCPPNWHVPSESDWNILFSYYINNGFAGSPLKYSGYSGFNALLNGVRLKNVVWSFNNFATIFWSSDPHGPLKAWAHGLNDYNPSVSFYPAARNNAFPVRCLKD